MAGLMSSGVTVGPLQRQLLGPCTDIYVTDSVTAEAANHK
jgi:hypothetical protein